MNKFLKFSLIAGSSLMLWACFAGEKNSSADSANKPRVVRITNWNLQAFGQKKASNPEAMEEYRRAITNSDIIFFQEIRDKSGEAFSQLCSSAPEYEHTNSSRAGRSASKEQYGVLYKSEIKLIDFKDYNPVFSNLWERPPISASFEIDDYTVRVYNIHIKPSAVSQELKNLEALVKTNGNVIILGDLNASGSYYSREKERGRKKGKDFSAWHWVIGDNEDTTVAKSTNAYDRIILNSDALKEFVSYSIYTNVRKEVSDHYPVSVDIEARER